MKLPPFFAHLMLGAPISMILGLIESPRFTLIVYFGAPVVLATSTPHVLELTSMLTSVLEPVRFIHCPPESFLPIFTPIRRLLNLDARDCK